MPTVDLTDLKGIWVPFFTRRLKLHEEAKATMVAAWRETQPDWEPVLSKAGVRETAVDPGIVADLTAAIAAIVRDADLAAKLAIELAKAEAEGQTGALALAADIAGEVNFDWDLAFTTAHEALKDLPSIQSTAVSDMSSVGASTVTDLGQALAQQLEDGASYADLIDTLSTVWDDAAALTYWMDVAMSAALSQGALDLYMAEGVTSVDWVTAGDARVCQECEADEVGSPYDPALPMPVPPQHGFCRCCLSADLGSAAWQQYVTTNLDEG